MTNQYKHNFEQTPEPVEVTDKNNIINALIKQVQDLNESVRSLKEQVLFLERENSRRRSEISNHASVISRKQ
jgi:uncharacterized protein YoxC